MSFVTVSGRMSCTSVHERVEWAKGSQRRSAATRDARRDEADSWTKQGGAASTHSSRRERCLAPE
eukprot:scaffold1495_cov248-Pinguiococcus_pyrenoidosus.AAC.10